MIKNYNLNEIYLVGSVVEGLTHNYSYKGVKYYKILLSVRRFSEVEDIIPVIISESILKESNIEISLGDRLCIYGECKSHNTLSRKLEVFVFAKKIKYNKNFEVDQNIVKMEANVCKVLPPRITPLGKKLQDVMVAVNTKFNTSYIPLVVWGIELNDFETFKVGKVFDIIGRFQSREYTKILDDGISIRKIAYEISVGNFIEK